MGAAPSPPAGDLALLLCTPVPSSSSVTVGIECVRELRGHDDLLCEVTETPAFDEEVVNVIERFLTFGRSGALRGLSGAFLVADDVLMSAFPRVYGASYVQSARCSVQYAHGFSPSQRRLRDLQLSQARVTRRRLESGRRSIDWSFTGGMMAT